MVKNSDDIISLSQSPSITQETKARFNELLNAAISRDETQLGLHTTSGSSVNTPSQNEQLQFVPKAIPRRKQLIKNRDITIVRKHGKSDSIHSSEESSASRTVSREVIVEVHSSRTRLLLSSSDDDVLSEKREKKKKKSKWKQVAETAKKFQTEGKEAKNFQTEESPERRTPSRLSNRSYTVETPTFPVEDIKLLTYSQRSSSIKDYPSNNSSPSRRSYIIDTPTILQGSDQSVLPKMKTPVPLPRRKSLKLMPDSNECNGLKTNNGSNTGVEGDNVITLLETPSHLRGDSNASDSVAVRLQESNEHTEDDREMPLAVRKQKRKKKRRKSSSKSRDQLELQEMTSKRHVDADSLGETVTQSTAKGSLNSEMGDSDPQFNGEKIVCVTIHGVDCPLVDPLIRHPMVGLHIFNTTTGEYLDKSEPSRSVCYFEETTSYIPPIMTHPFHFKHHKSMQPQWEECLVLNENISHLFKSHTLLLFELCDFLPASIAGSIIRQRKLGNMAGWHPVAWAFVRPVGADGTFNVGSRLRLQLYRPAKPPKSLRPRTPAIRFPVQLATQCSAVEHLLLTRKVGWPPGLAMAALFTRSAAMSHSRSHQVFEWWGTAVRHKYPGCLYVTVSAVDPPTAPLSPQLRSRMALQSERGSEASVRSTSASVAVSEVNSDDNCGQEETTDIGAVMWSRLPAQSCKIPNSRIFTLPVDGSMCIEFSSCGRWLACARQDVTVFSVPQFLHTTTLSSHQGLVYCLKWSSDSKILLSASADCTICVWRPSHHRMPLLQMLAHPSFVYCTQFLPSRGSCSVVSGCYDGFLRLWQGDSHSSYQLSQELCATASGSYITSVCITTDGATVVSADSQGGLRTYEVDDDGSLTGGRELRVREVRGKTISNVLAHPGGHRLLVHTRDNSIRSVDIATGAVIQTFKGMKNEHVQTGVCVSPCGSLVFACGEDGSIMVWDGHTGSLRAIYCSLLPTGSGSVHYHPHEHMLAVGSLAQAPVHVLSFNRTASGEEIGLNIIDSESSAAQIINLKKESDRWHKAVPKISASFSQHSVIVKDGGVPKEKKKFKEVPKQDQSSQPVSSSKWPSLPKFDSCIDIAPEDKDIRLLEIIQKMDNIILAAKQSSQP